ncbi:MAG: alpha/beta hydrolase [Sphingomonadales bacterium]|nr:alpha/beta hydrolase [Sphingomonadales bacterium]
MTDFPAQRIDLSTGVTLGVWSAGDPANPPIIFLHGFPESHRTWRHQMRALSQAGYYCVAPDQRGFAGSSKPPEVSDYSPDKPVADLFALADALGIQRFTLAAHDWGGAIAWMAALKRPERISRLMMCNSAHPLVFQRTLYDDLDQRAASQYMNVFKEGRIEASIRERGLAWFYDHSFMRHLTPQQMDAGERETYLAEWASDDAIFSMLNWYKATNMVVPPMPSSGEQQPERPPFLINHSPVIDIPTLVIWGMDDPALLPCQLELDGLVSDLTIVRIPDCGHFLTWEAPQKVNAAMLQWLRQ